MLLGIDVSTYPEELENGAVYSDGKERIDPLDRFRGNGVSLMRIRLWHTPYDKSGSPYLGGTCDPDHFLRLGRMGASKGYRLILDLHYSDFWADPGKQFLPRAWEHFDFSDTEAAVYRYTVDTLRKIRDAGLELYGIQIGNEITNGMLWPYGKLTGGEDGSPRKGYAALSRLLGAGIRASREIFPDAKIILHLERSNDTAVYDEFFTEMQSAGVDYDVIGASYYPYWHGSMDEFFSNLEHCRKFGKERMVMELGYAFTGESYPVAGGGTRLVIGNTTEGGVRLPDGYPLTPDGQAAFVREFLRRARNAGMDGVFYWEPLWLPGKNIRWASEAGLAYLHESGKSTLNDWANQCLYDYTGKALPALREFRTPEKPESQSIKWEVTP